MAGQACRAAAWAAEWGSLPSDEQARVLEIAREVRASANLVAKRRTFRLRTYSQCLVGSALVSWLVEGFYASTREEAEGIGQWMVKADILHHVCDGHGFRDKTLYYRFREDDALGVLTPSVYSMVQQKGTYGWMRCTWGLGVIPTRKVFLVVPRDDAALYVYKSDIGSNHLTSIRFDDEKPQPTVRTCGELGLRIDLGPRDCLAFDVPDRAAMDAWLKAFENAGTDTQDVRNVAVPLSGDAFILPPSQAGADLEQLPLPPTSGEEAPHRGRDGRATPDQGGEAAESLRVQLVQPGNRGMGHAKWEVGPELEEQLAARAARIAAAATGGLDPEQAADIPGLVLAMHQPAAEGGLELGVRRWLGMSFSDCFRGEDLLAWLEARFPRARGEALRRFGGELRRAGFFRHTLRAMPFSESCFFFWATESDFNRLVLLEETLHRERRQEDGACAYEGLDEAEGPFVDVRLA